MLSMQSQARVESGLNKRICPRYEDRVCVLQQKLLGQMWGFRKDVWAASWGGGVVGGGGEAAAQQAKQSNKQQVPV